MCIKVWKKSGRWRFK